MADKTIGTSERILLSALQLMQEKGFKSVTIKDIATVSEVSEMTVFRHFKTKMGVLEAAVNKYSYVPAFKKIFEEQLTWDLEKDLQEIAKLYLDLMVKNQAIYLISVQERTTIPELMELISDNAQQLRELLSKYFQKMQEKQEMVETAPELQALAFITMMYGYFSSTTLFGNQVIKVSADEFIKTGVTTFCNGIRRKRSDI